MAENTEGQINPEQPDIIEDNRAANAISSMLWVWKWVNRNTLNTTFDESSIFIKLPTFGDKYVGGFLETSDDTITEVVKNYRFAYFASNSNSGGKIRIAGSGLSFEDKYKDVNESYPKKEAKARRQAKYESLVKKLTEGDKDGKEQDSVSGQIYIISIQYFLRPTTKITTESPIKDFEETDAFYINTDPTSYYLRFGALLDYIAEEIVPRVNISANDHYDNPPLFNISRNSYENFMYSLPNQISLDPRVCIVRNDKFQRVGGIASVFSSLLPFRNPDFTTLVDFINPNKAYQMNIYLNFEFIIDSLNSNADEKGDINVYNFLKTVCDGLNKALGGINNLEPIMDEETNTLRIIDTTPIPGVKENKKYTLQLYGYNKTGNGYISNFVRKVDLKTAITPEFATMVTVGATAGGYVKGTEGTAFSKWNTGLTDRFKEQLLPGNGSSYTTAGEVNEAVTNYTDKFLANAKHTTCYGYTGNLLSETEKNLKISSDIIEGNLSVVTEYYKYLISSQKDQQGGTVGFIPFKLSFTMDGLSGIKIYNVLNVDTRFLPKAYGDSLDLIVTGVSHRLANNDWETDIETTVIPKTNQLTDLVISEEAVAASIASGVSGINVNDAPLGPNPPKTGWVITHPKYPNTTQAGKNIDLIIEAFKEYGVTNPYAIVGALCVIGKESGWIPQNEDLRYSKERLPEVWGIFSKTGKKVPNKQGKFNYNELAVKYAGNAEKLANFVYGWNGSNPKGMRSLKDCLGNTTWGDGYKYRGRGFNQITWKDTYEKYTKSLGVDLINNPDKLNEPKIAAKAAITFFKNVFTYSGKSNPIGMWNSFTSVDEALVYFAKANSGNLKNSASGAIDASRSKRPYFDIVKK
jgi:predicted chitinase